MAPHREMQLSHDMPVRWSLHSDDKLPCTLVTGNEVFLIVPLHKDYKRKKQSDSTNHHLISKGVQTINGVDCAEAHWPRCVRGVAQVWQAWLRDAQRLLTRICLFYYHIRKLRHSRESAMHWITFGTPGNKFPAFWGPQLFCRHFPL